MFQHPARQTESASQAKYRYSLTILMLLSSTRALKQTLETWSPSGGENRLAARKELRLSTTITLRMLTILVII